MARLFISQERIDRWTAESKVTLDGDRMDLPAIGASVRLRSAVHFLRVASGGDDPNGLLGRVKTDLQLRELGAEHLETSVILGEVAYDCEVGFVGETIAADAASSGAPGDTVGDTARQFDTIPRIDPGIASRNGPRSE